MISLFLGNFQVRTFATGLQAPPQEEAIHHGCKTFELRLRIINYQSSSRIAFFNHLQTQTKTVKTNDGLTFIEHVSKLEGPEREREQRVIFTM